MTTPRAVLLVDRAGRLHFAAERDDETSCGVAVDGLGALDVTSLTVRGGHDGPLRIEDEGVGEVCTGCYPAAGPITAGP